MILYTWVFLLSTQLHSFLYLSSIWVSGHAHWLLGHAAVTVRWLCHWFIIIYIFIHHNIIVTDESKPTNITKHCQHPVAIRNIQITAPRDSITSQKLCRTLYSRLRLESTAAALVRQLFGDSEQQRSGASGLLLDVKNTEMTNIRLLTYVVIVIVSNNLLMLIISCKLTHKSV